MKKRVHLLATCTTMAMVISSGNLLAAEPSNAELYKMIQKLGQELAETKAENQELRRMIQSPRDPGVSASSTQPAVHSAASSPVANEKDKVQAVQDKPIILQPKLKDSYLTFESDDGNVRFSMDGRVMLDVGAVKNDKDKNDLYTNTEFRRLRLAFKTELYQDWAGEFDLEFVNNAVEAKDVWVAYNGLPNTTIKAGNHKVPFSMDELTSSRWVTFMERAMITEFSPGRRIGLSVTNWQEPYYVAGGIFGDAPPVNPADTKESESMGWALRAAARPFVRDQGNTVLHLGANYVAHQTMATTAPAAKGPFRVYGVNSRPEAHFVDYKYLNTGDIANTEQIKTWGLELAGKWQRFYAQSEYMKTHVDVDNATDPEFDGWYAMLAYFLTNDSRPYDLSSAEFGPVHPSSKLGAFELALRYSTLDLNDLQAGIKGGEADNITVALNWYVNNNIILRANYIHVNNDANATKKGKFEGDDDLSIYGARIEYLF